MAAHPYAVGDRFKWDPVGREGRVLEVRDDRCTLAIEIDAPSPIVIELTHADLLRVWRPLATRTP